MKPILFIVLLLFTFPLMAQEKALEMSKPGTEKTRVFKENKRVKVKTFEGEKYIGRFQILDANMIEIDGIIIPLSSISNIKSRTAMAGILATAIIIYGAIGVAIGILSLIASPFPGTFPLIGIGAVITSVGIFFNEFARNYRHKNDWSYKIIEQ
ncbi:MAG TPA: hypothetical protein VFI78_00620 [Salinimicrobium sp.]|nr:hypothetical protein [Salinimicrobium sp.]